LAECETQNQQLRATNASIQQAITETEIKNTMSKLQIEQLSQCCAVLEKRAKAAESLNSGLRLELDAANKRSTDLGSLIAARDEAISGLNQRLAAAVEQGQALTGKLESRVLGLTEDLIRQQADSDAVASRNKELEARQESDRLQTEGLGTRCATLESKVLALEAEYSSQRAEWTAKDRNHAESLAQKSGLIEQLNAQLTESTEANRRLDQAQRDQSSHHQGLQAEIQALKKRTAVNQERLADIQSRNQVLNQENQMLAAQVDQLKTGLADAERSKSALIAERDSAIKQADRLSFQISADRPRLEELTRQIALVEERAVANSGEAKLQLELDKTTKCIADLREQLEKSNQTNHALSEQLPPRVPADELRAFVLLNVRTGDGIFSGTWAELTQYCEFRPEERLLFMAADVTMMPGWRINEIMCSPQASRLFIDAQLNTIGNTPDLPRLLTARFPEFEDLIPETVQRLKAFSFAHLQSMQQKRQRGAALEQPVTVAR
jgi:chromosome segregation ATPase